MTIGVGWFLIVMVVMAVGWGSAGFIFGHSSGIRLVMTTCCLPCRAKVAQLVGTKFDNSD